MGYGLMGVFMTLIMFMLVIRVIVMLFPDKIIEEEGNSDYDK